MEEPNVLIGLEKAKKFYVERLTQATLSGNVNEAAKYTGILEGITVSEKVIQRTMEVALKVQEVNQKAYVT